MKLLLTFLALAVLAVDAQNVSCSYNPTKSLTADFIPVKAFRTFGDNTNRENWCLSYCDDCTSVRATAAFQYQMPHSFVQERKVIKLDTHYGYCPNTAVANLVEFAVLNYNNIDSMTTFLKQRLNNPGWAYLLMQNSFATSTISNIFPVDNNFCSMTVSKDPNVSRSQTYTMFAGLVRT